MRRKGHGDRAPFFVAPRRLLGVGEPTFYNPTPERGQVAQLVEQRTEKTRGPVRSPRFVLRHRHSTTPFDPIGRL